MRSLLLRFFLAFWLIIGLSIGISALGGYWYAERIRSAYENFQMGDELLEASAALRSAGRNGLTVWLRNYPETHGFRLLVLDHRGRDLLDRPVPRHLAGLLRRQGPAPPQPGDKRDPENVLRARPLTQLIGPDGIRYTFILVPARDGTLNGRGMPLRWMVLVFALVTSALVSLFLARTISRPVGKLRAATRNLAGGRLEARVEPSVARRRDELGSLARDFDSMAASLQSAANRQAELSRNVSHELRSPLARMRVALELARQKAGEIPELDRIDEESERLNQLIGQLLSYSRLDSVSDTARQPVDLGELIDDVVDDVRFECESAGYDDVSIDTDLARGIVIQAHRESLRSAIENVLRNAIRHAPAKSAVDVSLSRVSGDVVATVSDRGPGVSDGDIDRLFEPFFRTPGTRGDGSGLGLAIAKRAVDAHGGRISAENRRGGGLLVTLRIPAGAGA